MTTTAITKLHQGDFNTMNQEWQPDNSVIVTLYKRGEGKIYRFAVKDLYGPNEELLWEEVKEV